MQTRVPTRMQTPVSRLLRNARKPSAEAVILSTGRTYPRAADMPSALADVEVR